MLRSSVVPLVMFTLYLAPQVKADIITVVETSGPVLSDPGNGSGSIFAFAGDPAGCIHGNPTGSVGFFSNIYQTTCGHSAGPVDLREAGPVRFLFSTIPATVYVGDPNGYVSDKITWMNNPATSCDLPNGTTSNDR